MHSVPVFPAASVPRTQMLCTPVIPVRVPETGGTPVVAGVDPKIVAVTFTVALVLYAGLELIEFHVPPSIEYSAEAMKEPPVVESSTLAVSVMLVVLSGTGFGVAVVLETIGAVVSTVA